MSELTRYDFEKVYQMSAMEFFVYVTYINNKREKEEERIRQFKLNSKHGH